MTEDYFPQVSYDHTDIQREASEERWAEIWVQVSVDEIRRKANEKTGNLSLSVRNSPMDGDMRSRPAIWVNVQLPLRNTDREGHIPSQYAKGFFSQFVQAIDPEALEVAPVKRGGIWYYENEEIDGSDVPHINAARTDKILALATKVVNDPSIWDDYTFFGKMKQNGDYDNLQNLCAELPDNAELASKDEWMQTVTADLSRLNGSKPAKPAVKKAGKKKTKK